MEKLEVKAEESVEKMELRCKGWCHDRTETIYQTELPNVKYFN